MKTSINFALILIFLIHFSFSITLSINISQNKNKSKKNEKRSSGQITNSQTSSNSTQYNQVNRARIHSYD